MQSHCFVLYCIFYFCPTASGAFVQSKKTAFGTTTIAGASNQYDASTGDYGNYEVCMSPGCIADGAQETLQLMQALAGGNVQNGVCCSLCGNGPIVVKNGTQKVRKVSSHDKIRELLGISEGDERAGAIFKAFELLEEAKSEQQAKTAAELYHQAIDKGLSTLPASHSLEQATWLIHALQAQTQCLLQAGDNSQAIKSAQSAVDLSASCAKETGSNHEELLLIQYTSLEVLQQALEKSMTLSCSKEQEVEVLQKLFGMEEPKSLTTSQKNQRRSLGFRLQKLERELNQ